MAAGSTYTPIQTYTLGSAQADVTFSSFSGYTDLVLVIAARLTGGGGASAIKLQFNGDTGNNYSGTILSGDGSTASSFRDTSQSSMSAGIATDASGQISTNMIQIMNYANITTYKSVLARYGIAGDRVREAVGRWASTSAITSIKIINNGATTFVAGSTFTLYGIVAA